MDTVSPVRRPGSPHDLTPLDDLPRPHRDLRQVRNRYLEPGDRLDGHRSHPCHRPGERHRSRGRGLNPRSGGGGVVDPPVAPVGADWRVLPHYLAVHRSHQANSAQDKPYEHLTLPSPNVSGFVPVAKGYRHAQLAGGGPLVSGAQKGFINDNDPDRAHGVRKDWEKRHAAPP